jgi:Lon protease-like protein
MMHVPLFPLYAVLYPGGPLPLRIFEPRYLSMISSCLKSGNPFGVLLIRDGSETGTATTYEVGTLAEIVDWYQGSDGLLGVTAIGKQRFRLVACSRQADGLNNGEIDLLNDGPRATLPADCLEMAKILEGVLDDLGKLYAELKRDYEDAGWVAYRYAEILPIPPAEKQRCLEPDDPLKRLAIVRKALLSIRGTDIPGYA